jgi:hypothetical protein
MTPGMPHGLPSHDEIVRVAEAVCDPPRREIVIVPVPHRLAAPGKGDVEPGDEGDDEERESEEGIALGLDGRVPRGGVQSPPFLASAAPRIRRRYVFWTWAGSTFRNFASSARNPRT